MAYITRRGFLQTAGTGIASAALARFAAGAESAVPRPNIVYVMADQYPRKLKARI